LRLRKPQFANFEKKNFNIAKLIIINLLNLNFVSFFDYLARVSLASLTRALNSLLRLTFMMMRKTPEIAINTRTISIRLLDLTIPL